MKTLLFICSLLSYQLWASPAFEQGRTLYDQGKFEQAWESYQSIPGMSANLDFNRANTLMRLGQSPEALAYYRRAQWQKNSDPDIRANLAFAAKDLNVTLPDIPFTNRLLGFMGPNTWRLSFILSCWFLALIGISQRFLKGIRNAAAWIFPIAGILILISAAGIWSTRPSLWMKEAIVSDQEITARFEPLPDATEHFSLPQGTLVTIQEESRNWVRIESGENQGWIPADSLFILKSL